LGTRLFSALQAAGGIAATVEAGMAAEFERDFEAGMDRFFIEHHTRTTELLRDMARFFAQFEPLPENLYLKLLRVLDGTRKKAIMVTTNYDLLIEHAVNQYGLRVSYELPAPAQNIPILKIHGSCNFLPDMMPRQISNILFDVISEAGEGASILESAVKIASPYEVIDFCDRENSVAPALAMYSPSKRILFCKRFIESQREAWLRAVSSTARIYVIGLRVHVVDEHIWGPLAKATAPIYYVGREPDEFSDWARSVKKDRRSARPLADSFEAAIPRIATHLGRPLTSYL
jgi:hypothetical protein